MHPGLQVKLLHNFLVLLHTLFYCCILSLYCCINFFTVAIYILLLHAYFYCWSSFFIVASQKLLLP